MCFSSCRYQNQIFFARVALVWFVQHLCRICVALVSLVSHSCCKLDQNLYQLPFVISFRLQKRAKVTTVKILKFLFDGIKRVLLNRAPSSTQLISVSTQLSATPSTIFEPKYCAQLANFPKFRPKKQKLSILTENWHKWYIGGVDSKSRLRFLKFGSQN